MTQIVKFLIGLVATILSFTQLTYGADFGTVTLVTTDYYVLWLMFFWGLATLYDPLLDNLDELKEYLHIYSAKKLGVEP